MRTPERLLRAWEVFWAHRRETACLAAGLALGAGTLAAPAAGRLLPARPWSSRRVALTFDDGPHPAFTGRLLDILQEGGARATFFVVGRPAEGRPDLVEEIVRRGHELGNHTYSHPNVTRLPREAFLEELSRTRRALDGADARGPYFFRPPGGRFNGRVLSAARGAGYRTVLWTVLPRDHENPAPEDIRRRVLEEVSDGGVILMHSGIENTMRVLPQLLEDLRARGYRCVTVGDLLADPRPTDPTALWLDAAALPPRRALPPLEEN